jgi:hypothetical protein
VFNSINKTCTRRASTPGDTCNTGAPSGPVAKSKIACSLVARNASAAAHLYIYICVFVCMCVCGEMQRPPRTVPASSYILRERKRERETARARERERQTDRQTDRKRCSVECSGRRVPLPQAKFLQLLPPRFSSFAQRF